MNESIFMIKKWHLSLTCNHPVLHLEHVQIFWYLLPLCPNLLHGMFEGCNGVSMVLKQRQQWYNAHFKWLAPPALHNGMPCDTDRIIHTLWERHLFQPGIFLLWMTPDWLRCWVWQASRCWRIWILGDESRSDICEGIGELWNFLHLHICIEFDWLTFLTKLFWT